MTTTSTLEITISLAELDLEPEELQQLVQNLLPQLREVDGVETADVVTVEQAPPNTRAFGGFVWQLLNVEVSLTSIQSLFGFLRNRFGNSNKPVKLKITKQKGSLDSLEIEIGDSKDLDTALQSITDFLNNTK
jgi:hypothetical protein